MKKIILISIFTLCGLVSFSQDLQTIRKNKEANSSNTNSGFNQNSGADENVSGGEKSTKKIDVDTQIEDYKIISVENDTTYVDTTLSVQKLYKYNYLRSDYIELLPFSNTGQTFNSLAYNLRNRSLTPEFGMKAKHFNYFEVDDVYYYDVPTPFTELFFKTTMEQGQLVDAFLTLNTHRRLNFSIAYKGLRSLGKYQNIRSNGGNFRATASYNTKNERYFLRAHVTMQNLENEENGGLTDEAVVEFENENSEFRDRSRFEVNFQNAENTLEGKRFYLDHYYKVLTKKDSISKNGLRVGHVFNLEDKKYLFLQDAADDYFGASFQSGAQRDEVRLERLINQAYLGYYNDVLGDIKLNVSHTNYNYGYNSIVILDTQTITNRLKGDIIGVGGTYEKRLNKKFKFKADVGLNVSGDFDGNYIDVIAQYKPWDHFLIDGGVNISNKSPDFNYLLFQSDYKNYNWQNNNFENIASQSINVGVTSKWLNAQATFSNIENYTYFSEDGAGVISPTQFSDKINYLKLKASKEFKLGKFGLDNTILYQTVSQSQEVFNVPGLTFRNTLYFATDLFKKNMFLQTGVEFNYFSKYKMNAYDPLLAEFYVANNSNEFGAFPLIDFFVNVKVRNARIYLKAEHLNSGFTGNNFYSAPNYPYKDFIIRFGMVWNFFL